jgi:hypothetical protein
MRVNWFSPLPPTASAASEDTARLLPLLRSHIEVTLWTAQERWDPRLQELAPVRHFNAWRIPWAELNRGDLNVYVLANDPVAHGAIWHVSRHHPGVVILYGSAFHDLVFGWCRLFDRDRLEYLRDLQRHHGMAGLSDADRYWDGKLSAEDMARRYPLLGPVVEKALSVLVHDRVAFECLHGENRLPVGFLPSEGSAQLLDWLAAAGGDQPRVAAYHLLERTAGELARWLAPEAGELLRHVGEQIQACAGVTPLRDSPQADAPPLAA